MPKRTCGTFVDTKGYISICSGPLRGKRVHVLVMEAKLGRKLLPDETIHHRDLNKQNPAPENLVIHDRKVHGHVSNRQKWFVNQKLAKIEAAERAAWLAWIESGGDRPDGEIEETAMMFEQAATAEAIEFDPAALERE